MPTNKTLGQHWLKNREILTSIAAEGQLSSSDIVLEIGPGLGTLTSVLLSQAREVLAIEYDSELARKLPGQFPGKNLTVVNDDFLLYDLATLSKDYKVVANIPYYISTKIIRKLVMTERKPAVVVLLVQLEVAEKFAAPTGQFSELGILALNSYDIHIGTRVAREYFTPPPLVDSATLVMKRRKKTIVNDLQYVDFKRLVHIGFTSPRKKLRSNLAAGLRLDNVSVQKLLQAAGIEIDLRAEDVTPEQWAELTKKFGETTMQGGGSRA